MENYTIYIITKEDSMRDLGAELIKEGKHVVRVVDSWDELLGGNIRPQFLVVDAQIGVPHDFEQMPNFRKSWLYANTITDVPQSTMIAMLRVADVQVFRNKRQPLGVIKAIRNLSAKIVSRRNLDSEGLNFS
jgi:hypothetical protein